jgi:hypothetical protein
MTPPFVAFPKIGRWANNKIAITEKIDGTNGVIAIGDRCATPDQENDPTILFEFIVRDERGFEFHKAVRAGSRERWLTLGKAGDNYGFARWVTDNAAALVRLGEGLHYGEWWGAGIQRKYGLTEGDKRFSLFNVGRWIDTPNGVYDRGDSSPDKQPIVVPGLGVVPTLYYGPMRDASGRCQIEEAMRRLQFSGSQAAPGFKGEGKAGPEGVMIYFETLKTYSKAPFDAAPKGL